MKSITIGDIHIYTEDGDTWDDLIQVIKKATHAFTDENKKPTRMQKFLSKFF